MALDAIETYTNGLKKCIDHVTNMTLEDEIFISGFSSFKYFPPQKGDYKGCSYQMNIKSAGIYIKYYPTYNHGELRLGLNISKIMGGINVCSIYCLNVQELFEKISFLVWPLLNLSKAPHLRYWLVSKIEYNLDIIDSKEKIEAIYSVLKKTSSTSTYEQCKRYDTGGKTIYYIPKRAKFESSDVVIKVYYKLNQLKECEGKFNIFDLYNSSIVNLDETQNILRIEVTKYRGAIYKDFKPMIIEEGFLMSPKFNYEEFELFEEESVTEQENVGTVEQAFNFNYQINCINEVLRGLNLNKRITTAKGLRSLIRSNRDLSRSKMKEYWNVVRHKNTNSHKKKPSQKVKSDCIKFILGYGYNCLYADFDVESIRIEDIMNNLPELQKEEIRLYKDSNIYKDMLFYKSTQQRRKIVCF
ncbi:hypothetical protein NNC19_10355 [Clostridium sp. SHJSY1]|uniref:hypothetical protein n=1 Tax=Clostridium sp. SHJSY1 TaxID=2942483 RepID=UPI0028745CCE|nr:hypothetical protein [Clostridium sp. SHJSY1]MDS0526082.1 hypothetical protein [Clostridium sp. SHJSY1]